MMLMIMNLCRILYDYHDDHGGGDDKKVRANEKCPLVEMVQSTLPNGPPMDCDMNRKIIELWFSDDRDEDGEDDEDDRW